MSWTNPTFFWAMLLVPAALGLLFWAARQHRRAVVRFGDAQLLSRLSSAETLRVRWFRHSMLLAAIVLVVTALAGPRFGTSTTTDPQEGLDLVVALDVSQSMLAEDVAPSRLERARHEVQRLVEQLHGDRFGLVLFAGDAFLQCPLTTDRNTIRLFLDAADPSMIPTPGTNINELGPPVVNAFESASSAPTRARVLLLVSDGEFHEGDVSELQATLREADITTLALGTGEAEGAPIPLHDDEEETEFVEDRDGAIVQTRLDDATLRELAGDRGYVHVGRSGGTAESLVPILQRLDRAEIDLATREVPIERYQWPLLLALLLLFAERLFPAWRRNMSSP